MKLVSIPANPVPDNVVTGAIKTPDGVSLRFARWAPPPGRKGTVVVLQGRAEFIEKYFETVRDLRARGFAVATFDWRGQGLSDRALSDRHKGHVRNFAQYETDLDAIMEQVVMPDCPPPIFCIGHSMGGAVAIRACHAGSRWFDRVVLSAPMIALAGPALLGMAAPFARFMRLLGRGGAYVPSGGAVMAGSEDFLGNVLTSDPVRFARNAAVLEEEPELGLGSPTIAWADAALARDEAVRRARLCRAHPPADAAGGGRARRGRVDAGDREIRQQSVGRPPFDLGRRPARDSAGAGSIPRAVLGGVRRLRAGHAAVLSRDIRGWRDPGFADAQAGLRIELPLGADNDKGR